MFRTPAIAPAVLLAALGLSGAAATAAPFSNGSLESSAPSFIETVAAGATANGWTAIGANVEFVRSGYSNGSDTVGPAQDGLWMVDLNGTQGPASIAQTFDTVAGQWYAVNYFLSGNAGPNGSTSVGNKTLAVYWNGALADTATYTHQPGDGWSNLRWDAHGFQAMATGPQTTLRFASTSNGYAAAGPMIDAISITPVPEPATALLWAGGAMVLLGAVRRRRSA
jgi:hypothetical protein